MGKLHTLHRAIEREPGKWHYYNSVCAAWRTHDGKWEPVSWLSGSRSYRNFVRHVLRSLGCI
jgi:hypothetical protein